MSERRTSPIDWESINPEIADMLDNDNKFLESAEALFSTDDEDQKHTLAEEARGWLSLRNGGTEVSDEDLVRELGAASLYLEGDEDYKNSRLEELSSQI